jgi:hypothetical protein
MTSSLHRHGGMRTSSYHGTVSLLSCQVVVTHMLQTTTAASWFSDTAVCVCVGGGWRGGTVPTGSEGAYRQMNELSGCPFPRNTLSAHLGILGYTGWIVMLRPMLQSCTSRSRGINSLQQHHAPWLVASLLANAVKLVQETTPWPSTSSQVGFGNAGTTGDSKKKEKEIQTASPPFTASAVCVVFCLCQTPV